MPFVVGNLELVSTFELLEEGADVAPDLHGVLLSIAATAIEGVVSPLDVAARPSLLKSVCKVHGGEEQRVVDACD